MSKRWACDRHVWFLEEISIFTAIIHLLRKIYKNKTIFLWAFPSTGKKKKTHSII